MKMRKVLRFVVVALALMAGMGLSASPVLARPSAAPCPVAVSVDGGTFWCPGELPLQTLNEGGSLTFYFMLSQEPQKDREVFIKLAKIGKKYQSDKKAMNLRGITFEPGQTLTFGPDNWHKEQSITITYPENNKDRRNLDMQLKHKIGSNWRGALVNVNVCDNDADTGNNSKFNEGIDCPSPDGYQGLLQALTVAAHTQESTYDRDDWDHWIDADGDCQNARHEVLIEESRSTVTFTNSNQCTVATGQWIGPWGGGTFTEASDVDVDHHVPLKNAHMSGGAAWSAERKRTYANDLALAPALQAMEDGLNQSKGAKGPEGWKPPLAGTWCQYARDWIDVKTKWALTVTQGEKAALGTMLGSCSGPAPTPVPTPVPVPAPQVGDVDLVSCDASAEIVTFRNTTSQSLDLTGFSIHDEGPNRTYNFTSGFVMAAGETWTLVSGSGATESLPDKRLLFTTGNVWNNAGDTAYLKHGSTQHDSVACQ